MIEVAPAVLADEIAVFISSLAPVENSVRAMSATCVPGTIPQSTNGTAMVARVMVISTEAAAPRWRTEMVTADPAAPRILAGRAVGGLVVGGAPPIGVIWSPALTPPIAAGDPEITLTI